MTQRPQPPQREDDWAASVETNVSDVTGRAGKVLLAALAGFAGWAALFPLDSAVHAPGLLVAHGQNKLLQHRAGGVVREIFATEGDRLKAGDPVVALDPNVNRAELERLRARYALATAMRRRLEAEQGGNTPISSAGEPSASGRLALRGSVTGLSGNIDPITTTSASGSAAASAFDKALADAQQREFDQGRRSVNSELRALEERIAGQERQRQGLAERQSRLQQQVSLLRQQYEAARSLVNSDYLPKQQMWDLQSRLLEREAELQSVDSQHDAAANSIAEIEAQADRVRSEDLRQSSEQISKALTEIEEVRGQLVAAESALSDTVVRAPSDGTLVHSKAWTIGGVIPAGEAFGEIVPTGAKLEILVRVQPSSIVYVKKGGKAKIKLTALNTRLFDDIPAEVTYVAADASVDQRTGEHYFEVRAALDPAAIEGALAGMLTPGMAGDATIETGSRTFLAYLVQPLSDSFARAFRETH